MQKKTTASGQKKKKSAGERRNLENRSEKKHSESLREIQKDNEYAKYELDACKRKQLQNKKEFLEIICQKGKRRNYHESFFKMAEK